MRSSAAMEFQLSASSRRSDIGRRRAARTVSATASGSRTAPETGESVVRAHSSENVTGSAYRASSRAGRLLCCGARRTAATAFPECEPP
jgi:hypothetical protein